METMRHNIERLVKAAHKAAMAINVVRAVIQPDLRPSLASSARSLIRRPGLPFGSGRFLVTG